MVEYPKEVLDALEQEGITVNKKTKSADGRIVYGACCTWWDTIDKVAILPEGLPCCPHCKGVLFEVPQDEWDSNVSAWDEKHPGYGEMLLWMKGKCFKNYQEAEEAFQRRQRC